jgi:RNA polymerase sigma-70 factor (ECF subfamily)
MQIAWATPTADDSLREQELVLRAKQRDTAAWSTIYSEHYDSVYRYIYGRLGKKDEAEDLSSQVFLEALQSIDSFKSMGRPLVAWLFGIARNVANSNFRRVKKLADSTTSAPENTVETLASWDSFGPEALDLSSGISRLTKEQRDVLILRFYVGMSAREVGCALGKTEPAVYALQMRAIASLRRLIGSESYERRESAA